MKFERRTIRKRTIRRRANRGTLNCFLLTVTGLFSLIAVAGCNHRTPIVPAGGQLDWQRLADLPDEDGLAGSFAGFHENTLIVAGGSNFPEEPLWEKGPKVWHDQIFIWREGEGWQMAGNLPGPVLGYGASVETDEGVVCIGGSSTEGFFADVFRLAWRDGAVQVDDLPSLPRPLASPAAALVGRAIYVAGGQSPPPVGATLRQFWKLDLDALEDGWVELEPWPGPSRFHAVAGTDGSSFFLFSGLEIRPEETGFERLNYLADAYRFHPERGWTRLEELPNAAAAAPTPAPFVHGRFLISGGGDGSHLGIPTQELPDLPDNVWAYDAEADRWEAAGKTPAPHVGVPVAKRGEWFYFISGEKHPGVRSPLVWRVTD